MIEFFTNQWIFGPFLCKLFHYMQFFTSICSILNLSFMGLGNTTIRLRLFMLY